MGSPVFKGSHDGPSYCEQCGAHSPIRSLVEVSGEKKRLCPECAAKVPRKPIEIKPGKPSRKVEWRSE